MASLAAGSTEYLFSRGKREFLEHCHQNSSVFCSFLLVPNKLTESRSLHFSVSLCLSVQICRSLHLCACLAVQRKRSFLSRKTLLYMQEQRNVSWLETFPKRYLGVDGRALSSTFRHFLILTLSLCLSLCLSLSLNLSLSLPLSPSLPFSFSLSLFLSFSLSHLNFCFFFSTLFSGRSDYGVNLSCQKYY